MDSSIIEIICPVNVEWKFKKADLMDLLESENGYLNGKSYSAFNIPGFRYSFRIYPYGDKKEHRGKTNIIFFGYGLKEDNDIIEITMTSESSNYSQSFNTTGNESDGTYFCDASFFFDPKNNFFVNGEFTIKVQGNLKVQRPPISKVSTPISMRWKVKEDDLKAVMDGSSDAFLCSEKMSVPSFCCFKYYLAIYPMKINDENESETFIYLFLVGKEKKKVFLSFDAFVDSANYNSAFDDDIDIKSNGGGYRLCSTSDLFDSSKKFIVDGYLTININGLLLKEMKEFVSILCKNGVAPKSAWKKNDKNFLIVVDEKKIEVHKQVLMDASPVLSEIFESRKKEAIENKFIIEAFSFKIVEAAIKLCYRKNGCRELIFEEMISLYKFAKKYRIRFIMNSVEDYLIKKVSPSNVVYLIKFSAPDSYNIPQLYETCINYMIKCSKHSTPVYASECLDEKLLAKMYLKTLDLSVF